QELALVMTTYFCGQAESAIRSSAPAPVITVTPLKKTVGSVTDAMSIRTCVFSSLATLPTLIGCEYAESGLAVAIVAIIEARVLIPSRMGRPVPSYAQPLVPVPAW